MKKEIGQVEVPRCALLLVMFTFCAPKADTARCKHLLGQAGLPQLLLASISCRMKHAETAESSKDALLDII